MALVRIEREPAAAPGPNSWDIGDDALAAAPRIPDFAAEAARLRERARALREFPVSWILEFLAAARAALAGAPGPGDPVLPGIAYLYYFLAGRTLKGFSSRDSGATSDISTVSSRSRALENG